MRSGSGRRRWWWYREGGSIGGGDIKRKRGIILYLLLHFIIHIPHIHTCYILHIYVSKPYVIIIINTLTGIMVYNYICGIWYILCKEVVVWYGGMVYAAVVYIYVMVV